MTVKGLIAAMVCYTYDGSFEGLLTAIYEAYYRKEKAGENPSGGKTCNPACYIHIYILLQTLKNHKKVYNSIMEKISEDALDNIYHVFLADREYGKRDNNIQLFKAWMENRKKY